MPDTIFNPKIGRMQPVTPNPSVLDALNAFAENQDAARSPAPTAPPLPAAPAMFRPQAPNMPSQRALTGSDSGFMRPTPQDLVRRGGISSAGPVDWAAERAGFLNRENPFAADIALRANAMEGRRLVEENAASDRPDLFEDIKNQYALQGLRRASEQADPAYQRQQEEEDAIQQALTFMNPQIAGARHMRTNEAVNQQRQLGDAELEHQMDPRQQLLDMIRFLRQQALAQTQASGRNPLLGMMGGLTAGAGAAAPTKRGDPMGIR